MDDQLATLYKRAKRAGTLRVMQPRIEDLVSRRASTATWRALFKFLELPEKAGELTSVAQEAIADLELRQKVLNKNAPGWVHASIIANTTLHSRLRKLRRELEYAGKASWPAGGIGAVAMR